MKLSFVIPAYNEEKNIGDCVGTILAEIERFKNDSPYAASTDFEVIVVNNASIDRTGEIARNAGARVVDESKKGILWARKAGLEASEGDIIANIDADNRIPTGWIQLVVDYFMKMPDLLALSGPLNYYDSPAYVRVSTRIFYCIGYAFDKIFHVGKSGMLQGGNYAIRKSVLQKIGGYDTSITFYGEDTDIATRVCAIGKIIWTFKLSMNSSGRRIEKEGLLHMGCTYAMNYLWATFFKKPFSMEYKDHRDK